MDMFLYTRLVQLPVNNWNKDASPNTAALVSLYSHRQGTSNDVRRFPAFWWNLLLPLDSQFMDFLWVKCLNLLLDMKWVLQDDYSSWHDGCPQIWQNLRWQMQDGCTHGKKKPCGIVASSPVTGTILELHGYWAGLDFSMSYIAHRWSYATHVPSRCECCCIQILC